MSSFEFASPRTEAEAVELLAAHGGRSAILAGGTDLHNLLRADLIAPSRVVDLKNIGSMQGVSLVSGGLMVGALTTLDEILAHPLLKSYASLLQVADGVHSIQIQAQGTLGGDLCHLPNCWYYRSGYGLLGINDGESLVADGRNEFHAIFGNRGPAKFVSASRFAPALIALGAKVRIVGPAPDQAALVPLEYFYVTPKTADQGVTVLQPGQFVSHVWLPELHEELATASYEVLQLEGLDWPLASASVCLETSAGIVREARVVLGHVAPTPWISHDAGQALIGQAVSEASAEAAGLAAVAPATPLSENEYKVRIARTAVKRAVLRAMNPSGAVNQLEGVS
ncbi:MAG TPA: FAD binding domain-containing protein [Planctomycetaceae bacterium]|nr:FAD binding domain-containing protein [Planctomycetaceae bacterium]